MNNRIDFIDQDTIITVLECYNENKHDIEKTAKELAITPEYLAQILAFVICKEKLGDV